MITYVRPSAVTRVARKFMIDFIGINTVFMCKEKS